MTTNNSHAVLIVDDDKYIRDSVKQLMSKWHIETDKAENGVIAIEKLKNKKYSLVLLDIKMDNKDGIDVLKEMKKSKILTPVILITAYPHDERIEKVWNYNIALCLVKPISPSGLKKAVKYFIGIPND